MPVHKVSGGYKYGAHGKVYKKRVDAVKQGQAIEISKHQGKPGVPKKRKKK
jgi:hypothetical protein